MNQQCALEQDCDLRLTKHAMERMRQRGITLGLVRYLLEKSDIDCHAKSGCRALHLRAETRDHGDTAPGGAHLRERATRLRVIESARGKIVTVMWDCRRRGRLRPSKSQERDIQAEIEEAVIDWYKQQENPLTFHASTKTQQVGSGSNG